MSCLYHSEARRAMMSKHDGENVSALGASSAISKTPIARQPSCPRATWSSSCSIRYRGWSYAVSMLPMSTETRGAPPFDPAMMVCLLLYAYCVGVFSSRKIALACERNLAFLAIVGTERPDFRTISDFRKQHLEVFTDVFVHVVRLAGEAGSGEAGQRVDRWDENPGQCVASQGDELWVYEKGRGAPARGD